MDKKMYHATTHKSEREPQHLPGSRATSYVPASQAIRMDSSLYEPVNIMNSKLESMNGG